MKSMGKIRVLEIIHGFAVEGPLGGIERFGIELARALSQTDIEPILCGLWHYHTPFERRWLNTLRGERIQAFLAAEWDSSHPYRSFWRAWQGILDHLSGQTVHLIHSHCQFGDGIALLVAHPLQARFVLRTVHNEREWPKRPGRRLFLTNMLYPFAFRLEIGISHQVADNLAQRPLARLLKRQSLYVPNAIDLERFAPPPERQVCERNRRALGIPLDAPLVGSIGRLTRQKGYMHLLQSAGMVLTSLPNVHFLIIGEGELENELKAQASRLGIASAVHFAGARSNIEELLAVMDLFVSSSLWEGLPTVLLESMAARVPVVATDVSGTRELVQDGVTGLLVPPGDPRALSRAMIHMLQNLSLRAKMAEIAYQRVQDFSMNRIAARHCEIYHDLLAHSSILQKG